MSDLTIAEGLDRYRREVSILKRGYEQEKHRITVICRSPLASIITRHASSVDIANYRDWRLASINQKTGKPISNATVRLEMSLLSNFFDIGRIEWGITDANPVLNVRKPKTPPGRDRRLTAREERLILRHAHAHPNPELFSMVVLGLETAMRQGEMVKLRWEHINLKSRVAHLPETKNGSKRDVPLSVRARDVIIRLGVKSRGPVFSYTNNGIKSTWRFMVKKLGIEDLHFHDLRHEATSRLFELGTLDMMEIAAITGHKSLSMLKRYTHLKAQRLVRKLEGHKGKGRQILFDHLIPYPAELIRYESHVSVRLLDFSEGLSPVRATSEMEAIQLAQDLLMRVIVTSLKESRPLPPPDQYLDHVDETRIVMIDPVPTMAQSIANTAFT